MASNPLPVLPEVPVPKKGNVWATLTNEKGEQLTLKLPDDVLWPPVYLMVGNKLYGFTQWTVPANVSDRIDVPYELVERHKCIDITDLVREAAKARAA